MAAHSSRRRTSLGLAYPDPSPAAVDWQAVAGGCVHLLAGDPGRAPIRLFDLTPWPRFGLKGRGSCDWLRSAGLEPPPVNEARRDTRQQVEILRLGNEDIVLLSLPDAPTDALRALRQAWEQEASRAKGYDSWRDEGWAWFHLYGDELSDFMAMTCPVDLHPDRLALWQIRQTRVAHMDCTIVHTDRAATYGLDLFFDVTSSDYMLRSLKTLAAHDR